jgi:hypothetical protein
MSYEEEDTCQVATNRLSLYVYASVLSYEEEDTCQVATNRLSLYVYASVLSYEEEDTCQVATVCTLSDNKQHTVTESSTNTVQKKSFSSKVKESAIFL